LDEKFAANDNREEEEFYRCKKGHRMTAQVLKGYSSVKEGKEEISTTSQTTGLFLF
jgi:hypothetical protein